MNNTKISLKKYALAFIFLLSAILFAAIFSANSSVLTVNATSAFSGGNGSSGSPYIISTEADLAQLAEDVNSGQVNGYYNSYFKMNNNLNLNNFGTAYNSGKGWIPIGNITYPFKGSFDGSGFAISNLYIRDTNASYLGLFGYINSYGVVKDVSIEGSSIQGKMYAGAIAGQNEGSISGCVSSGSIRSTDMFAGGIAGYNDGTISNSVNKSQVVSDVYLAGGIAGTNMGSISASYNLGTINGYSCSGGISGNNSGNIFECYNAGIISGHDSQGGIAGTNDGSVLNTYNLGAITALTTTVGGIIGSNDWAGVIKNVYNKATINAVGIAGALVGHNLGLVEAGFFDKNIYSGAAVGSGVAVDFAARTSHEMTNANALTDENKLKPITNNDGAGKWIKRAYDSQYCYYPELSVFYNSVNAAKQADSKTTAMLGRLTLTTQDIDLEKISFVYDGTAHEPDILWGTIKLTRDLDYTAVYSNNVNVGAENNANVVISFINHFAGSMTKYFSVTKAPLSITWDDSTIIYNGNVQFPLAYVAAGRIGSENITFVYSGYESNVNAGEHTVTVSLDNTSINNNYYLEPYTHTYTIEKRSITLTWGNQNLIYSGYAQHPLATVATGKIGTENITLEYSGYENNINAVSEATHSVVGALANTTINANYYLEPQTHYYSIAKKQITVTWDNSALYYNANPQHPKVNNIVGKVGEENITFDYTGYNGNVNASSGNAYTVTASLANTAVNANYSFISAVKYYDISKANITISWLETELIYNGTAQHHLATVATGKIGTENITLEYYGFESNINASVGAVYTVSAKLANTTINANYAFTPENKSYSIAKAPLTVDWNAGQLIYNGAVQHPSAYIVSGLYLSDTANLTYSNYSGLNVGSGYAIKIESINTNYYIANTLTYSINPAPITVNWSSYELIYNGTVQRPNAVVVSGLFGGDTVGLQYSGFDGINAGSGYEIEISSLNGNYYVQNILTYSITPSPITLTWDNNLKYNGQAQRPTATIGSGKIGDDDIILEYFDHESNICASIGSAYTVNVRLADNEINKNYVLVTTTKAYDIAKAEIIIAWKSETNISYNGQNQHPEAVIVSDVVDTVGLVYSNYNSVDAGSGYTIAIESDNPNYLVVNALTYSIDRARISVNWDTSEIYYNGLSQHPSASILSDIPGTENITFYYIGFENNIKVSADDYYSVTLVLDSNSFNNNFCLDETAIKNYDILKKAITINGVVGIERSYDGTLIIQLSGGELVGVLSEDTVSFILGSGELYDANVGDSKAVKTDIILSGDDADQYELVQPEDVFVKISKAVIDMSGVSFESKNFIYSGTAKNIFITGDLPEGITVVYSGNEQINVGEYMVTARFVLDDEINFEPIENMTAYMYIAKASFDISNIMFSSQTFAHDGNTHNIYIEGDLPLGVSIIYENNGQKDNGKYEVIVRFIIEDTDNYEQIEDISAYLYITQSKYEFNDKGIIFEIVDGYLDYGTSINVNKTQNEKLGNGLTALVAFDITFMKDNTEIQPNANIKITITLSEKVLNKKGLQLVHINGEGEIADVEFEIINGQLVFYANSFSTYALVADKESYLLWYLFGAGILLLLITGISIILIRKKRLSFSNSSNTIVDSKYNENISKAETTVENKSEKTKNESMKS